MSQHDEVFEDFLSENARAVSGGKNHRAPRSKKSGGNTYCRSQGLVYCWELPTTYTIINGKIRYGKNEDKLHIYGSNGAGFWALTA